MIVAAWIAGFEASAGEWVDVGPVGVSELTDAAVHPLDALSWAAVTLEGEVWTTPDAGRHWRRVLEVAVGSGTDERVTEIEARLGELAPGVELPEGSDVEELDPDELEDAIQAAADEVASDAREAVEEVRSELAAPAEPSRPRVWFSRDGVLVVARADGLVLSGDGGATWSVVLHEPVTAWTDLPEGGALAGTPSGLLRSATGVDGWTPVTPFAGVSITDLGSDGAVRTTDGVWAPDGDPNVESGWVEWGDRLFSPSSSAILAAAGRPVWDVEVRDALVLVVSPGGSLRLVPQAVPSGPASLEPWVPLDVLIDASRWREPPFVKPGRRFVAAVLPELSIEVGWEQAVGDTWNADSWTIRGVDTTWDVHGVLTWRAGATPDPFDGDVLVDDVELVVFDDEVVVDDGSATWLLASKVARGGAEVAADRATTVSGLYLQRQQVLLETDPNDGPLIDRVHRALWVAELDATLDLLTDGAVSAWTERTGGGDE